MCLFHVLLHIRLVVELFIANSTKKGFLPRMGVQVPRQLILSEVGLGTNVTDIFTFLRGQFDLPDPNPVDFCHVNLHDALVLVLLLALGTFKVPNVGVRPHVSLQHTFVGEFLVAEVAFEFFVPRVPPHVAVVVRFDGEFFAAYTTEILPELGISVYHQFMRSKIKKNYPWRLP